MDAYFCDARPRSFLPGEGFSIRAGEVHVWLASLGHGRDRIQTSFQALSWEEQEHTLRFRFERDRNEFITAHSTLRILLAGYIGQEPHLLRLRRSRHGKPILAGRSVDEPLSFSMSYSRGLALYGVVLDNDIGVDIEHVKHDAMSDHRAGQFFSPDERAALQNLAPRMRAETFFRFWTLKEAFVKAKGLGLSYPFHLFDVSSIPEKPVRFLSGAPDVGGASRWMLINVPVFPGYAAAVAYRDGNHRLVCRQVPGQLV